MGETIDLRRRLLVGVALSGMAAAEGLNAKADAQTKEPIGPAPLRKLEPP